LTGTLSPLHIRKSLSPNEDGLPSGPQATSVMERIWPDGSSICLTCPQCGKMLEDKAHVLLCGNSSVMQVWEMSLKHLKEWLKSQTTYRLIAEAIL